MFVEQMLARAHERLATIGAVAPMKAAASLMAKPHTDLLVVCDHAVMVGVVTKTDIIRHVACFGDGASIARIDTIMTRDVVFCRPADLLQQVWSEMKARGHQRIPVIDANGAPVGIIYSRDALQNLLGEVEDEGEMLRDYIGGVGYR